jgi:hypothetical protein
MVADTRGPYFTLDQHDGEQRFRADLAAYLDSLSVHELAELIGESTSSRQQPLQLGVLLVALNERLPDAYKPISSVASAGMSSSRLTSFGSTSSAGSTP